MLNENVSRLLNEQVTKEFWSAYLYLEISNYFADMGLDGFSNWFLVQYHEENSHALLFVEYLKNNSEKIKLLQIDEPNLNFDNIVDPLEYTKKHEIQVTALINAIYKAAHDVHDYRTMQFLDWFIKEQAEEEKNIEDLLKKMELFGSDPKGLYLLDQELGARVYSPPTLTF